MGVPVLYLAGRYFYLLPTLNMKDIKIENGYKSSEGTEKVSTFNLFPHVT